MTQVDLAQVEDLKTIPEQVANGSGESAMDAANRALDEALNPGLSAVGPSAPVNDLSGMVRKKKKPAVSTPETVSAPNGTLEVDTKPNGKRKAEEDAMEVGGTTPVEKKAKLEEDAPAAETPA